MLFNIKDDIGFFFPIAPSIKCLVYFDDNISDELVGRR